MQYISLNIIYIWYNSSVVKNFVYEYVDAIRLKNLNQPINSYYLFVVRI